MIISLPMINGCPERWHNLIRAKPGQNLRGRHISNPEDVEGAPGVQVRLISVVEDDSGFKKGVYVETNILPEAFHEVPELRDALVIYVGETFAAKTRHLPSLGQGPWMNLSGGINFQYGTTRRFGALVMRLEPGLPLPIPEPSFKRFTRARLGR